ncbi:hypothetical protein DL93DRAFT_2234453, partial [Clavulina sp. PMI_390]
MDKTSPAEQLGSHNYLESRSSIRGNSSTVMDNITVPDYGVLDLSFEEFYKYIGAARDIQRAPIINSECYRRVDTPASYRFIVLELQQQGGKVNWLRLDRLPAKVSA